MKSHSQARSLHKYVVGNLKRDHSLGVRQAMHLPFFRLHKSGLLHMLSLSRNIRWLLHLSPLLLWFCLRRISSSRGVGRSLCFLGFARLCNKQQPMECGPLDTSCSKRSCWEYRTVQMCIIFSSDSVSLRSSLQVQLWTSVLGIPADICLLQV